MLLLIDRSDEKKPLANIRCNKTELAACNITLIFFAFRKKCEGKEDAGKNYLFISIRISFLPFSFLTLVGLYDNSKIVDFLI